MPEDVILRRSQAVLSAAKEVFPHLPWTKHG
jgi:hypothetical protein